MAGAPVESLYRDDQLLPLSALQHVLYCERQCALIHLERIWAENRFTAEGRVLHERVHEQGGVRRGDVRVARALPLRSLRLGVTGVADVVEFHGDGGLAVERWQPFPVEYKRGRPKAHDADRIQLCAQAMCLEEMLGKTIEVGALFYGDTRRRLDVGFDEALRALTAMTARRLHALVRAGRTPPAVYEKRKCERCSLMADCMPRLANGKSVKAYVDIL